jgi:hypothetical protein
MPDDERATVPPLFILIFIFILISITGAGAGAGAGADGATTRTRRIKEQCHKAAALGVIIV